MKEQHKKEIFATFRALSKEEREAFIKYLTGKEVVGITMNGKIEQSKDEDEIEGAIQHHINNCVMCVTTCATTRQSLNEI